MQALQQPRATWGVVALSTLLLGAAVAVRGMGATGVRPAVGPPEVTAILEPMQLLGAGARHRIGVAWPHVPAEQRNRFREVYLRLFDLEGCPQLSKWLQSPDGQAAEGLIRALGRGTAEERLTAMALVFQIARATSWSPSMLRGSGDAVRMGALLESHLSTWTGATLEGYEEPVVAALLLYGRAMRAAWKAPMLGSDEATLARARSFLERFLGHRQGAHGPGAQLLRRRHPLAWEALERSDPLTALDAEARRLLPELDGDCGE